MGVKKLHLEGNGGHTAPQAVQQSRLLSDVISGRLHVYGEVVAAPHGQKHQQYKPSIRSASKPYLKINLYIAMHLLERSVV